MLATKLDFTPVSTSLFAVLVCGSLQRLNIKKKAESKSVYENNERMLVLEDDFEILYEIDLNNHFSYVAFTKESSDTADVAKSFIFTDNFFNDVIQNAVPCVYEDDLELFNSSMNIDFVRQALEASDHYDFIYRLKVGDEIRWKRTRFVYKNNLKNSLIVGSFDAQETMMKRIEQEQARNQLIQNMIGDDALFVIDLEKDTRQTLRNVTPEKEKYSDSEPFSSGISRYIDDFVIDYDKKKVRDMTSIQYIKNRLEKTSEYSFKYREISSGAQKFFEMRFAKYTENEVLMSVADKDVYILTKSILEKFKDNYFTMFAVDTDEGFVHILKEDIGGISAKEGDVVDCKNLFMSIAEHYEKDTMERKYFERISDPKYLKQKLISQDTSSFVFRLRYSEDSQWAMVKEMVLTRDLKNNEPAIVALILNYLDREARESEILKQRLKEDMNIIGGLADEFKAMFYLNLDEDVFKIREVDKNLSDVINSYVEKGVTKLGLYCFANSKGLKTLTIGDGLEVIDNEAFGSCIALTNITFGKNVKEINDSAFYNCASLETLQLPTSLRSIGSSAFSGCKSLKNVTIPSNVNYISPNAFYGAPLLSSYNVDSDNSCYCSIDGVIYSKDKTKIEMVPKTSNLTSFEIPSFVSVIDDGAFGYCTEIESIIIPDSVTTIGSCAFYNCRNLKTLVVPKNVTSIGSDACCRCDSLVSITLPKALSSIGLAAFSQCNNLENIVYEGTTEEWNNIENHAWLYGAKTDVVHCSDGDVSF